MAIIGSKAEKLSQELLKIQAREQLEKMINLSFDRLIQDFNYLFSEVWVNSNGLSPQEVFDSFGEDASSLFLMAQAVQDCVNTIQPKTLDISAPAKYSLNKDGTVTIHSEKDGAAEAAVAEVALENPGR